MNTVFVTRFPPSAVGHGGQHRSYQVWPELRAGLEPEAVHVFTPDRALRSPRHNRLRQRLAVRAPAACVDGHPDSLAAYILAHAFRGRRRFAAANTQAYARCHAALPRPALSGVDHPLYTELVAVNRAHGVPTINRTQTWEPCDLGDLRRDKGWSQYGFMADVVSELKWLRACDARLLIAQVEAGPVGGLGLPTHNYPPCPVGEVCKRLEVVRPQRRAAPPEPGLFLMVGSAAHATTRDALDWFVAQARAQNLPPGARVVSGGLKPDHPLPRGVEARGRMVPAELEDWLTRGAACLVPRRRGWRAARRHAGAALWASLQARRNRGPWSLWARSRLRGAARPGA